VAWRFLLKVEWGGRGYWSKNSLDVRYPSKNRITVYALLRRLKMDSGILGLLARRYRRYAPLNKEGQLGIYLTFSLSSF
jgi:hypothetical protein